MGKCARTLVFHCLLCKARRGAPQGSDFGSLLFLICMLCLEFNALHFLLEGFCCFWTRRICQHQVGTKSSAKTPVKNDVRVCGFELFWRTPFNRNALISPLGIRAWNVAAERDPSMEKVYPNRFINASFSSSEVFSQLSVIQSSLHKCHVTCVSLFAAGIL